MHKQQGLPELEQAVLAFWRDEEIFQKVVDARRDAKPFVFYDGPPFTTGLPHYGHILQMAIKDAVLRYKTMQGFRVPRKIGWDTHGLPVEYELEKELKLSGKREIEAFGIDKFVEAARGIVLRCTDQWKHTMERMGRWVDVAHPYTTMDNNYIESVWWAFSELHKKDLVYKDFRVSPYCPRCGTVISNFEVNQGYKDNVPDTSVYVAVPVTTEGAFQDAKLVLWTTTPWTLPSNVAVAVDAEATYVVVEQDGSRYILGEPLAKQVFPEGKITQKITGRDLLGLVYDPLYKQTSESGAYRVVSGHHVTMESGTGLVHMAPAYGEDDFKIGRENGLPLLQSIEPDGTVTIGRGIPGEGLFFKDADRLIIEDLATRDLLVRESKIQHTYPFCWRCDTPLLYYPTTSWYIAVTKIKDELLKENAEIDWLPQHLRDGRFGRWLEGARDWAVSRDRYWGAPLPVWECAACERVKVVSSRAEIGVNTDFDLHRPYIDEITLTCDCGEVMRRVPFVFDCWFESGSMPYAQHHYPFENAGAFNPETGEGYPADFIAEALDQTRGWFYTLHVLGVALFNKRAYNSVVVSGLLLASDGKKLSKRLRNYTPPEEVFESQGVDALRLFLFTATTVGEDYRFSDEAVADVKRRWITPLLNVVTYWQLSQQDSDGQAQTTEHHALLDAWIKARVAEAAEQVEAAMEGNDEYSPFDIVRACRSFGPLVEDLSTWYVRLSRGRKDPAFTETLTSVLQTMSQIYAPYVPFLSEHIYRTVGGAQASVHLTDWPNIVTWKNAELVQRMDFIRNVVTVGRELRSKAGIPLRQPLALLQVATENSLSGAEAEVIRQELQVLEVGRVTAVTESFSQLAAPGILLGLDTAITPDLKNRGLANVLRRTIQDLRKQANLQPQDKAFVTVTPLTPELETYLVSQLGATELTQDVSGQPLLGEATHRDGESSWHVVLYRA